MPVEIRELVIRAVVQPDLAQGPGGLASTGGDPATAPSATASSAAARALDEDERAEIIEAAVREVLRILKSSKER